MKAFLYGLICCLLCADASAQEMQYTVLFDYDKYDIPDTSMVNIVKIIREQQIDRVLLEGHCDNIGSKNYNYTLSDQRAWAVKKLLIANGVFKENIKQCIGFGKDRPLTANETPEERQINRRVVMTFYLKDEKPRRVNEPVEVARQKEPVKTGAVKQEAESQNFLKIQATNANLDPEKIDYKKKTSSKNESSALKPVVIKAEPEKKEFLTVGAGMKPVVESQEDTKKVLQMNETSAKKPVIVKSEPEKKDFLVVEDTKSRSVALKSEPAKAEAQVMETSAHKPVIVKSEPEKRDFLSVTPPRNNPIAVKKDAPQKENVVQQSAKREPVVIKNEVVKQEFLQVTAPTNRVEMEKIGDANIGDQIVLENILFEPGRHILKGESMDDLEKLLVALKEYPTLEIEIQGHVCCTTTEEDGFDWDLATNNLSQTRAEQIYLFLTSNGISANRLQYKGYGGTRKINQDETKEELRRVNRRVEIKILKK